MAPGRVAPVPLGVIALWLAYRLAPFVPTLDWQKYKAALKPLLLHPHLTGTGVFRYLIGWLVVGEAVQQLWPREYTARAVAGIAAIVLLGCLVIVGKGCSVNEIVALALVIPVVSGLRLLPEREHRAAVALSLAGSPHSPGAATVELLGAPARVQLDPLSQFHVREYRGEVCGVP